MDEKYEPLLSNSKLLEEFSLQQQDKPICSGFRWRQVVAIVVFTLTNVVVVTNHFLMGSIIGRIKEAFDADDMQIGLLQSSYEIVFVASTPVFGYLGDRYKRLMIVSFALLLSATCASVSCLVSESSFAVFSALRSITAFGGAANTVIIPSIISDMFVGTPRTIVLTAFLLASPTGLGIGCIGAGAVAAFTNNWRWAFGLTPLPLFIVALCLLIILHEPQRGEAENTIGLYETTHVTQDLKYLIKIPSFILVLAGHVCLSFTMNALASWTPDLLHRANTVNPGFESDSVSDQTYGSILIIAGIFGVASVVFVSNRIVKPRYGPATDGLVPGVCMLVIMAPASFIAYYFVKDFRLVSWAAFAVGISIYGAGYVKEVTLSVVIATRRSTAEALQSAAAHLGDAGSPYFIGLISDHLRSNYFNHQNVELANYSALQAGILLISLVVAASGGFFLFASLFINNDNAKIKKNANKETV